MNLSITLNAQALTGAFVRTLQGKTMTKECLCIPLEDNPAIFKGKSGVYLRLTAWEKKEVGKYGDTHFVKEDPSKEAREKMTEEQLRALPIVGSGKVIERKQQTTTTTTTTTAQSVKPLSIVDDDLPFD